MQREAFSEYMSLTLYRLEGCPYCEYVVDALDELDLEFESVWVEGMHAKRNEVKRVSGQRQVPVLIDEERGVTMAESDRIIEYLERSYDDADALGDVELAA
jgi:glutathione S-transferase